MPKTLVLKCNNPPPPTIHTYLAACKKCKFWNPVLDLLNQKLS